MAETINYLCHAQRGCLGRPSKRQRRGPYQRGVKPHDNGHLNITSHNPRAESPDYHTNLFACLVCFVVIHDVISNCAC